VICDDDFILRNEATAAPDDPGNQENEAPPGPAVTVESGGKKEALAAENVESRPTEYGDPATATAGDCRNDHPQVKPAESQPPAVGSVAGATAAYPKSPFAHLTKAQLHNQRVAMFQAMQKARRRQ
jgi:hypothetical protein